MRKFVVDVTIGDEEHCEGKDIETCLYFAIMDGMMDHFEFYRPELETEEIYHYMERKGFNVLKIVAKM